MPSVTVYSGKQRELVMALTHESPALIDGKPRQYLWPQVSIQAQPGFPRVLSSKISLVFEISGF